MTIELKAVEVQNISPLFGKINIKGKEMVDTPPNEVAIITYSF